MLQDLQIRRIGKLDRFFFPVRLIFEKHLLLIQFNICEDVGFLIQFDIFRIFLRIDPDHLLIVITANIFTFEQKIGSLGKADLLLIGMKDLLDTFQIRTAIGIPAVNICLCPRRRIDCKSPGGAVAGLGIIDIIESIGSMKNKFARKNRDFGSGYERRIRKQFYDKTRNAMKKGLPVGDSSTPGQI